MELLAYIALLTIIGLAVDNRRLRKEIKKKIDFDYEEYLLYRKSKDQLLEDPYLLRLHYKAQ